MLRHIPRLDTFRAIAALAVVWTHFFAAMLPDWLERIAFGATGVTFFFVLSGYLITQVLLADDHGGWRARLRRFYIRRTFRIFPLYYFVLLAGLALGIQGFSQSMPWSALYLMNFCPVLCGDVRVTVYASHLWTLAVEEQFYLVWPLLVVFLPRRWLIAATIFIIVGCLAYVYLAFRHPSIMMPAQLLDWSPVVHAPALLVGALLALVTDRRDIADVERALRWLLPVTAPCMLLISFDIASLLQSTASFVIWPIRPLGQALFMAWLIAKAVSDGPDASTWGGRVLPALGTISYGIYVYHLPILGLIEEYGVLASMIGRLVAVGGVIVVASASYVLMEKPLRRWGRGLAGDRAPHVSQPHAL